MRMPNRGPSPPPIRAVLRRGLIVLALAGPVQARSQPAPAAAPADTRADAVSLFKVVGPRDEVTIGLTGAELQRFGTGPGVERLAKALVAAGSLTVWQYAVGRAPDGSTRFAASRRIAILRQDATRIEPYAAALPVMPPPAE